MKEVVLIPRERVGVIKDRKVKNKLEKTLKVKIVTEDNSVEIEGDGLELYQAKNIVKAIGRGFSPKNAFKLLNEDEELEIIELRGFSEKKIKIIKSRIIGTKGKARSEIERKSGAAVSVYGKTISLIGKFEQLNVARGAVKMLIRGSKHSRVYKFLEKVS